MAKAPGSKSPFLELNIAAAAWLTAVAALAVSIWQVIAIQQHQELSVMPLMAVNEGWSGDETFVGIQISNQGLGPALVKPIKLAVDGKGVAGWSEAIAALGIDNTDEWLSFFTIDEGRYPWKSGVTMDLFGLALDSESYSEERRDLVLNVVSRIGLGICYCSMYDQCQQLIRGEIDPIQCTSE